MDDRQRQLQRAWEAGDPASGLAYARALHQSGSSLEDLEPELGALLLGGWLDEDRLDSNQVKLAALAGLPAAQTHLQSDPPAPGLSWLGEAFSLPDLGPLIATRWHADLLQALSEAYEVELPDRSVLRRLLDAVAGYAHAPSPEQAKRLNHQRQILEDWHEQGLFGATYLAHLQGFGRDDAMAWAQRANIAWHWIAGLAELMTQSNPELRWALEDLRSVVPEYRAEARARSIALTLALEPKKRTSSEPTPYSPKRTYEIDERVDHPKFGVGKVARAGGKRIEVQFESGLRKLAQGL